MIRAAIVGIGWWGRTLVNAVQGKSSAIRFTAGYTGGATPPDHAAGCFLRLSNRLQQRPPFRAQSRPLLGLIELCGVAFAGVGRLWVSGLPERPSRVWRRQATYP
jgi:hypothetical protein